MSKRDLIISTIVVLVFVIGVGIGVYYFVSYNNPVISPAVVIKEDASKKIVREKPSLVPLDLERVKKEFPEVLTGIIKISEEDATITIEDGKEYILLPQRPKSIYDFVGIENGQKIEIQGKFLDKDTVEAGSIKAI